jgi:cell division initiation protein
MIDHTKLNDLRGHEFSKTLRGYSIKEVDEFVESLLFETGLLVDGVQELTQRIKDLDAGQEEIRKREEVLSATLVAAQAAAEDWKTLARKESDQIIRDANLKVEEILRKARLEAGEHLEESRERWRTEDESRARIRHDLSMQIARMKGEVESMKVSLDRWERLALEIASSADG